MTTQTKYQVVHYRPTGQVDCDEYHNINEAGFAAAETESINGGLAYVDIVVYKSRGGHCDEWQVVSVTRTTRDGMDSYICK